MVLFVGGIVGFLLFGGFLGEVFLLRDVVGFLLGCHGQFFRILDSLYRFLFGVGVDTAYRSDFVATFVEVDDAYTLGGASGDADIGHTHT